MYVNDIESSLLGLSSHCNSLQERLTEAEMNESKFVDCINSLNEFVASNDDAGASEGDEHGESSAFAGQPVFDIQERIDALNSQWKSRIDDAKKKLEAKEAERRLASQNIIKLERLINEARIDNEKLAKSLCNAKAKSKAAAAKLKEKRHLQLMCENLKAELGASADASDKAVEELKAERGISEKLQTDLDDARTRILEMQSEAERRDVGASNAASKIKELEGDIATMKKDVRASRRIASELDKCKKELGEKKARIKKLEKTKLTKEDIEKIRTIKVENSKMRKELIKLKAEKRLGPSKPKQATSSSASTTQSRSEDKGRKAINKENSDPQSELLVYGAEASSSSDDILDNPPECAQQ